MYMINGVFIDEELNEGFQYGYGIFETIKISNFELEFFHEHMKRLFDSCKKLKINLSYDIKSIYSFSKKVIEKAVVKNGSIKIIVVKNNDTSNLIIKANKKNYKKEQYEKGFKLKVSNIRKSETSILVGIKSLNYMENIYCLNKAKEEGYNEVIFLNTKNCICEGSISNIFFVKDKIIYTPSLENGILNGIMRNYVINIIKSNNIKIFEGNYKISKLLTADEIFITNSLMGIMPISTVNNITFNNFPMTNFLINKLSNSIT